MLSLYIVYYILFASYIDNVLLLDSKTKEQKLRGVVATDINQTQNKISMQSFSC